MLYKVLERMVARGMTDELRNKLRDKIDTLYALGRLTQEQYMALVG